MPWNLFCIDPSTRDLGWAVFRVDDGQKTGAYKASGHIKLSEGTDEDPETDDKQYVLRADKMSDHVYREFQWYDPRLVLVELPRVMPGKEAAMRSDAITKLGLCVGVVRGFLRAHGYPVQCVPVAVWKGQTPKSVTQHRVLTHWSLRPENHNEADAIGIGDWYIRKSLKYRAIPHTPATKIPARNPRG